MNHWHVYEYMKNVYMRTGTAPSFQDARAAFPTLRAEVILEGVDEFWLTVGRFEKGA